MMPPARAVPSHQPSADRAFFTDYFQLRRRRAPGLGGCVHRGTIRI